MLFPRSHGPTNLCRCQLAMGNMTTVDLQHIDTINLGNLLHSSECLLGLDLHYCQKIIVRILHVLQATQITLGLERSHGEWTAEASLASGWEFGRVDKLLRVLNAVYQWN